MIYEVSLLAVRPGTPKALSTVGEWVEKAPLRGKFLACWQSELGVLGQIFLLHAYEDAETLRCDRETITQSTEGFGLVDNLSGLSAMACLPFPSFTPLEPGIFGPVFEVRSYLLRAGALPELRARWENALPARRALSKPLIMMHSTDGAGPRLIHIWPYASLEERHEIRTKVADLGLWPPKGPSGTLLAMQSEIFVPGPISPIR
jgi:NIPSNAP protein